MRRRIQEYGLDTYDLKQNPKYKGFFEECKQKVKYGNIPKFEKIIQAPFDQVEKRNDAFSNREAKKIGIDEENEENENGKTLGIELSGNNNFRLSKRFKRAVRVAPNQVGIKSRSRATLSRLVI